MRLLIVNALIICCFLGCGPEKKQLEVNPNELKKPLIDVNRSKVKMENDQIDAYINRRGWKVTKTGTGLRYFKYEEGKGDSAKVGQLATVDYVVTLINGDTVYSTQEGGPQSFVIEMDNVESGLHEGIQYMREGDKAILILPSYLAHGLLGDRNKIPPRSTIFYNIELLNVKDK